MLPNKELQELAQALRRSAEYTEMTRLRRKLAEHPRYGRHMLMFEREHSRISGLGLSPGEAEHRLKKLYADYKELLREEEVKKYFEAARLYQKHISDCVAYLNRYLDTGRVY